MKEPDWRPYGDRVLVSPLVVPVMTSGGGIRYADTVAAYLSPQQGQVVAIGKKVSRLGVGENVLFGLGVGEDVFFQDLPHVMIREKDVICLVN